MKRVLTIGEAMALFIAQEEGELKDVTKYERHIAGAELNVAIGLTRLDFLVEYITKLGKDPFGEYIKNYLAMSKIGMRYVSYDESAPTGFQLKNKVEMGDPTTFYYRKNSAATKISDELIQEIDLKNIDLLHVSGVYLGVGEKAFSFVEKLIKKAKEKNVIITFDPNLRPTVWKSEELMIKKINHIAQLSDYFLPGINEGTLLTEKEEVEEIANYYLKLGCTGVIIKDGGEGCEAFIKREEEIIRYKHKGFKISKVVDTVGAGDGFAVGIISGILDGLSIQKTLARANAIGAMQVSSISDNEALPTRVELKRFLERYSPFLV